MLNPSAYALGANRSCIRDLFEYGCQRAAALADLNEVLKKIPSWADICRQREEAARRAREAK